ncbi:MlaA family lipoprotein [Caulobacter sp. KR2-114]|uniref:MlaA family lipoprotein n=1 Tax=Caulobacter sp. KR2-114 TaxID=3400912 RepID=UPI003C0CB514
MVGALAVLAAAPPGLAQTAAAPVAAAGGQVLRDPAEKENRKAFAVGMRLDRAVLAPLAHAYLRVATPPVAGALGRAIHNLDEPRIAGNDLLQGHPRRAASAGARFVLNATVGVGGLLDPAGQLGLRRHESDFGQTLGRYGVGPGPYGFMPLFGPGDARDGAGQIVDLLSDPLMWATGGLTTTFSRARRWTSAAQARVDVDGQMIALNRDFVDPYAALRAAYSQQRAQMVRRARGEPDAAAVQDLPDFDPPSAPQPQSSPDPGVPSP